MSSGSLPLITKLTLIAVVGSVNLQRIPHSAYLLNVVFGTFQPSTNRCRRTGHFHHFLVGALFGCSLEVGIWLSHPVVRTSLLDLNSTTATRLSIETRRILCSSLFFVAKT